MPGSGLSLSKVHGSTMQHSYVIVKLGLKDGEQFTYVGTWADVGYEITAVDPQCICLETCSSEIFVGAGLRVGQFSVQQECNAKEDAT
jgi:hypothetical protein